MQNRSTRLSRSDPLSGLTVGSREVLVGSLKDRHAGSVLLLRLLTRSGGGSEEVVGSVGHRVLLTRSGRSDGWGDGFGGDEELLVREVEAGGEGDGETSVFGASEAKRRRTERKVSDEGEVEEERFKERDDSPSTESSSTDEG